MTTPTDVQVLDALKVIRDFLAGGNSHKPVAEPLFKEPAESPVEAPSGRKGRAKVAEPQEEPEAAETAPKFDKDELSRKRLNTLKQMAAEVGYDVDDLDGYDKEDVIALLLEENEEAEEEDEEEDEYETPDDEEEDDEEEEDEDDEGVEEIDEDALRAMSLAELKALARDAGIKLKAGTSKDVIIDMLLDSSN